MTSPKGDQKTDNLTVWTIRGPWRDEFGEMTQRPATAAQETARTRKPIVPVYPDPKPADAPSGASERPYDEGWLRRDINKANARLAEWRNDPHLPADNMAIDMAQDRIADNLRATFERYVSDFLCRPSYDRLERIRTAGMSMLDHELSRLRSQQEPAGIGMSDRST